MADEWRKIADAFVNGTAPNSSKVSTTSKTNTTSTASNSTKTSSTSKQSLMDSFAGSRKTTIDIAPVNKKKKEEEKWYEKSLLEIIADNKKKKKKDEDDIAPTKAWYESGLFEDGYDFGDVTKTILGITDDSASLKDLTVNSAKRGYYNSLYGEESFKAMNNERNQKEVYEKILAGDEYQFTPGNGFGRAVSGAFELLGQQARQFTNPRTIAAAGTAATAASIAGQIGPQVLLPEEILTVPAATIAGFSAGSATSNLEIEAGHAYNEMVEAGISEETAKKVAWGVGSVNAGLEMLQVDELVDAFKVVKGSGATQGVAKKLLKELADRGVDVAKETAQEVAQEGVTIAGVQAANKIDKGDYVYTADEVKDRLVDTAKSSALSFGMMNVPAVAKNSASIVSDQKKANSLTQNEQAVFDFEVNKRITEEEKDGKKLTNTEKGAIEKQVRTELERGYISIESIEEALGGDSYKAYNDLVKEADEFNTLYKTESGKLSEEMKDRLAELKEKNKANPYETALQTARNSLSESVMGLAEGSRLAESYNERSRRGQAFEADLSKYDEKQRAVVQKAIDSGILNNTNRTHEFVDMIAKISADKGVLFDFTNNEKLKSSGFAIEGKTVNGFVTKDGVTLNIDSAKALNTTVGHEITHVLEGTELYSELQNVLFKYSKDKGDFDSRKTALAELYKDIKDADIDAELTADLVGDYLFTDADFINRLSTEHRNVFQKIYDEIKYLCKVVTAGSKEARELEKVKKAFEQAYKADGKGLGDTKYSVSDSKIAEFVNDRKNSALYDAEGKEYFDKSVALYSKYQDGTANKDNFYYNTIAEFNPVSRRPKNKPDFVSRNRDGKVSSEYWYTEDGVIRGSDHWGADVSSCDWYIGGKYGQSARVKRNKQYGFAKWSDFVYKTDLLKTGQREILRTFNNSTGKGDYTENGRTYTFIRPNREWVDVETGEKLDGSVKYSISTDSTGKELTPEQREYFKDSKVTDENGNLKVVYHGTNNHDFHEFKIGDIGYHFGTEEQASDRVFDNPNARMIKAYLNIKNPLYAAFDFGDWRGDYVATMLIETEQFEENENRTEIEKRLFEIAQIDDEKKANDELREYLQSLGYDGVVYENQFEAEDIGGLSYIAFNSNQIKNIDNTKPTDSPDIRYSISDSDGKQLTKEQQNYFKDSKVRDDNGNLKVMYHGSQDAGFHVFDSSFSDDDTSFFFVDRNDVAASYSGTTETYEAKTIRTAEDMNNFLAEIGHDEDYSVVEKDGKFTLLYDGDRVAESNTAQGIYDEFCWYEGVGEGDANYKVYLNLTNPLEIDAQGRPWNKIDAEFSQEVYDRYNSLTAEEKEALHDLAEWEDFRIFNSEIQEAQDNALASAYKKMGEDVNIYDLFSAASENFSEEALRENSRYYLKTRDYAQRAKEQGYDGVIFKNIVDNGGYSNGSEGASTVAIAFNSNQIKSVANAKPTADADIRYSLSKQGETPKTHGGYNVSGKDIALAPVKETVAENASVEAPTREFESNTFSETEELYNLENRKAELDKELEAAYEAEDMDTFSKLDAEYASVIDRMAEINSAESDRFNSLDDADAPPEVEAPYYEDSKPVTPKNPFADKNIDEDMRHYKSFVDEHPDVKPLFQYEAEVLLQEWNDAIRGERIYNSQTAYELGNEYAWKGSPRLASEDISYLLDSCHYTYNQIKSGLQEIIEDAPKKHAVAKRIEFLINDRLLDGYTYFGTKYEVPPNQDYIDLLNEWQVNEDSTAAFDMLMENADAYAPPVEENIAPVKAAEKSTVADEVAPTLEEVNVKGKGNIRGQKVLADVKPEAPKGGKTANVLTEMQQNGKKGFSIWSWAKEHLLDNGMVFEDVAKRNDNRELEAKWNKTRNAAAMAQRLIGKGANGVKSLKDIEKKVSAEHEQQFLNYLYHVHNIDRMSLDERFGVENKAVFGDEVTADISRAEVKQYESAYPQFKEWAKEVYAYNKHLRNLLVDNGVISQETAALWEKMYPHYVPTVRVDDEGVAVNVPLDTYKTGVNAPVKRATGGNSDIRPLFDVMAQRTMQTYRAITRNSFGVELKNTLGSTVANDAQRLDDVIDGIDYQEELLKEGKRGANPTFTVFENGERVEFEITEEMYEALKPKSKATQYKNKLLNGASDLFRKLTTEYNPTFFLTNPIKDVQDVLINSQHPGRTYLNIPRAIAEQAAKGKYYQEYLENGGENNTYFDTERETFAEKGFMEKILAPVSFLNNHIEMTPRLAEYIASRQAGRSIDVAMLDAARVTTNFAAGGDVTKLLNRNGATFLNASVQGAIQQVRNVREAHHKGLMGYVGLATRFAVAGLPAMVLNNLLWEDDEEYEELKDYIKQGYYIVGKTDEGKFIRIPKGRTLAVIQDAFQQVSNAMTGDDEVDLGSFLKLVADNIAPNNPLTNNIAAPLVQAYNNKAWYDGDIVPTRLQDLPATEQYDHKTDALSIKASKALSNIGVDISPYKINYVLNQYSGGLGDTLLPFITPKAESSVDTAGGKLLAPLRDKFTTDPVMNNRVVDEFYDLSDALEVQANSAYATDEDMLKSMFMTSHSYDLSDLYKKQREIQSGDLPDSQKYANSRAIQKQINEAMEKALGEYGNVDINGVYAEVGDRRFNKSSNGKWYELSEDYDPYGYYEREQEVTQGFGISYGEYWNNRETYNDAYWFATSYGKNLVETAKSVFGAKSFASYANDLSEFKADYDENGKSISGSKKAKVQDYVYSLNIPDAEKHILFKSQYNSFDDANMEIIDYLNGRDDINYSEMESILKELGFEVDAKGYITW